MAGWSGILVALAIGLPLLGVALWLDRRRQLNAEGKPAQAGEPRYVRESEIWGLPIPPSENQRAAGDAVSLPAGPAHPEFRDVIIGPANVLVVSGPVNEVRELLAPIAKYQPLVIVATGYTEDVLATLAANRRALGLPVLATRSAAPDAVAAGCGAQAVPVADLKSGYLPAEILGSVASWECREPESLVIGCNTTPKD